MSREVIEFLINMLNQQTLQVGNKDFEVLSQLCVRSLAELQMELQAGSDLAEQFADVE